MDKEEKSENIRIKELVEISHFYGSNIEYVIAGGGNTSFKNKDKIWIKASGTSLGDIEEDGFVCLSRELLKKVSTKNYSQNPNVREAQVKDDLNQAIIGSADKRPSVETSLHDIIDFPFIVHTHPTLVNALLCSKKARSQSRQILGKKALYIKYTDPGYVLFKQVDEELKAYRERFGTEPSIILLQNHGIFVSGNSIDEIKSIYTDIEEALKTNIRINLPPDKDFTSVEYAKRISGDVAKELGSDPDDVLFRTSDIIQLFVKEKEEFEKVSLPFTPDDIVYCKSKYIFTSAELTDIKGIAEDFKNKFNFPPKVIGLEGRGVIAIDSGKKSTKTVMDVFENMMKVSYLSENFGGPQFMTPEQIDFIDNWEVENYRRQMAQGSGLK